VAAPRKEGRKNKAPFDGNYIYKLPMRLNITKACVNPPNVALEVGIL
jgi:hypothetical protein